MFTISNLFTFTEESPQRENFIFCAVFHFVTDFDFARIFGTR